MQRKDRATGEYQCECGEWIDEPGICDKCKLEIDLRIEDFGVEDCAENYIDQDKLADMRLERKERDNE